jgi:hypothetical protein
MSFVMTLGRPGADGADAILAAIDAQMGHAHAPLSCAT